MARRGWHERSNDCMDRLVAKFDRPASGWPANRSRATGEPARERPFQPRRNSRCRGHQILPDIGQRSALFMIRTFRPSSRVKSDAPADRELMRPGYHREPRRSAHKGHQLIRQACSIRSGRISGIARTTTMPNSGEINNDIQNTSNPLRSTELPTTPQIRNSSQGAFHLTVKFLGLINRTIISFPASTKQFAFL
jgi:hypothetical protein